MSLQQSVEETRLEAALSCWARAVRASRLRHLLKEHDPRAAGRLAKVKDNCLKRVLELAPEEAFVTPSDVVGMLSVRFRCERLHVPAAVVRSWRHNETAT